MVNGDALILLGRLIKKYNPDEYCPIDAQHDIIYIMIDPHKVSKEDHRILTEVIGCHQDGEDGYALFT